MRYCITFSRTTGKPRESPCMGKEFPNAAIQDRNFAHGTLRARSQKQPRLVRRIKHACEISHRLGGMADFGNTKCNTLNFAHDSAHFPRTTDARQEIEIQAGLGRSANFRANYQSGFLFGAHRRQSILAVDASTTFYPPARTNELKSHCRKAVGAGALIMLRGAERIESLNFSIDISPERCILDVSKRSPDRPENYC